jgi:hypothetical protein
MSGQAFADRDRTVFRGLMVVGIAEAVRYGWLLVLT